VQETFGWEKAGWISDSASTLHESEIMHRVIE
jgi:hypothetical protein